MSEHEDIKTSVIEMEKKLCSSTSESVRATSIYELVHLLKYYLRGWQAVLSADDDDENYDCFEVKPDIELDELIVEDAKPSDLRDQQVNSFLLTSSEPATGLDSCKAEGWKCPVGTSTDSVY